MKIVAAIVAFAALNALTVWARTGFVSGFAIVWAPFMGCVGAFLALVAVAFPLGVPMWLMRLFRISDTERPWGIVMTFCGVVVWVGCLILGQHWFRSVANAVFDVPHNNGGRLIVVTPFSTSDYPSTSGGDGYADTLLANGFQLALLVFPSALLVGELILPRLAPWWQRSALKWWQRSALKPKLSTIASAVGSILLFLVRYFFHLVVGCLVAIALGIELGDTISVFASVLMPSAEHWLKAFTSSIPFVFSIGAAAEVAVLLSLRRAWRWWRAGKLTTRGVVASRPFK